MPFLKSLIIVKDGTAIVEEYMNGGREELCLDLKSASKSILSALVGVALQENYLKSIDQKVMDFFPEYATNDLDSRIFDLTIKHLLTMKAGFNSKESVKAYRLLNESSDWIRAILHLPFKSNPGEKFNYHSFNTHLLSAIITKAVGMSTLEYSKKALFSPLNIDTVLWEKDPKGYYIGGWAMSLGARDMAKFGLLYLNNGKIGGTQIVPAEWIKQSTIVRSGMLSTYYSRWKRTYGYGYLWWVKRIDGKNDIPFALGHGGQRIAFMPDVKVVMVTQADSMVKPSTSHKQHRAIDSLLFDNLAKYFLKHHGAL
jgi:CubicO group peptidase (beta-lactamase class C family)